MYEPLEYPCWAYHHAREAKLLQSEEEFIDLVENTDHDWTDAPVPAAEPVVEEPVVEEPVVEEPVADELED